MSVTRKQLADTIDEYDQQIAELQAGKRETYQSYREELTATAGKDAAKAEIDAFKVALKRRQAIAKKGEEAIEDKDALAEEIFAEISASRAPRATRTRESDLGITRIQSISGALEAKTGTLSITPDPATTPPASQETTAADPAEGVIASPAEQAEPSDAAVTEGNDLREPLAAAVDQILREGDAPLEADAHVIGEVLLQQVEHPESISATHHGGSGAIPETAAAPVAEGVSPNASSVTPFLAITAGGQAIKHQGAVS